jgi:hypothetical protein
MKQISLRLDDGLVEEIDRCRGLIPRESYIRSVLAAEVAMASLVKQPAQQTVTSMGGPVSEVIGTTLQPGQISLAPSRPRDDVIKARTCQHAWTKVDGKSVCKHCGQTYAKEKV